MNISRSKVKMEQEVKDESKTLDKTAKVEDEILRFKMKDDVLKLRMTELNDKVKMLESRMNMLLIKY